MHDWRGGGGIDRGDPLFHIRRRRTRAVRSGTRLLLRDEALDGWHYQDDNEPGQGREEDGQNEIARPFRRIVRDLIRIGRSINGTIHDVLPRLRSTLATLTCRDATHSWRTVSGLLTPT